MDGSVQIVNQLGTDRGLSENHFNGGKRVARVAIKHRNEGQVFAGGLKTFLFDCRRTSFGQPRQGFHGAMQELTDLSARLAALVTRQPLGSICQHELVAFFHRFTTIADLSQHRLVLGFPSGWTRMTKKRSRLSIARDHALPDRSRGPSSRRSSIS